MMEEIVGDWTLESRRSNSLPNLLGLASRVGSAASEGCEVECGTGGNGDGCVTESGDSQGSAGSRRLGGPCLFNESPFDVTLSMHIPYDTLMEASRSMERLQMELDNREQVIRELVQLRARDKNDFEQQMNYLQGQLQAERSKLRSLTLRQEQGQQQYPPTYDNKNDNHQPQQPRRMMGSINNGGSFKGQVVTGGITMLNDALWNNAKTGRLNHSFPFHDDFMI